MNSVYSGTPGTRTVKGNEEQFELARIRVDGVDCKIQFAVSNIDSYRFFSTSAYSAMQI